MRDNLQIKTCPTCGSDKIQWVVQDIERQYKGRTYSIPKLGFYDCPNCGERVYDHEAMQKIKQHSPAYHKAETMKLAS